MVRDERRFAESISGGEEAGAFCRCVLQRAREVNGDGILGRRMGLEVLIK